MDDRSPRRRVRPGQTASAFHPSLPPQLRQPLRRPSRRRPSKMPQSARMHPIAELPTDIRERLFLVWLTLMVGLAGLTVNLFRLQILGGDRLQQQAQAQQSLTLVPFVPRHPIVDRDGHALALDEPAYTLYVHPVLFKEPPEAIARHLATIVDQPVEVLLEAFSTAESGIRIASRLDRGVAEQITALHLDGVDLEHQQQRYYPQSELFSHIVGYVNVDRQGQAGVEYVYQDHLERPVEPLEVNRTGEGAILPEYVPEETIRQDALSLRLTVDSQLQRMVSQRLRAQLEQYDTDRGTVIVMDVRDGAILAMVTEPSFDPNRYYETDLDHMRNWAVSDVLEPGSTFKPINLAIAFENSVVQPGETFYDGGYIEVGGWTIANSDFEQRGGHGQVSITDILKYSSNVGMVQVMQRLQPKTYYQWLQRLGIGKPSGVDLPFEAEGVLKPSDHFVRARVEPATAAFGQGISLSPLQLLQLQSAIANGGKLVTPYVVQGLYDDRGRAQWQPDRRQPQPLFSPETAQDVLGMMEAVVQEGTGKSAQVSGYRIAGKTGTAQKASRRGGYDASARVTSFVGIFPVQSPRYAVLAVVDDPKGSNLFGSTVAAPIVKSVIEFIIGSEAIPSDLLSDSPTGEPSEENGESNPATHE